MKIGLKKTGCGVEQKALYQMGTTFLDCNDLQTIALENYQEKQNTSSLNLRSNFPSNFCAIAEALFEYGFFLKFLC